MITAYVTQKSSDKHFNKTSIRSQRQPVGGGSGKVYNVVVDSAQKFQTHMGFGGAFTEAALEAVSVLPAEKRKEVIDAYFSKDGLCYNLARLPMHSTDFSSRPKIYVEEGDKDLKTFDVSWDEARFNLYKECRETSGGFFTLVSTWSPPAFMKSNNRLQHGGKLLDEYKQPWAQYYCKFLEALKERDIYVDALTVQNEPEAVQRWESCEYTAEDEGLFIRDYLHPALVRSGFENTKIVPLVLQRKKRQPFRSARNMSRQSRIFDGVLRRTCIRLYHGQSVLRGRMGARRALCTAYNKRF